MTFPSSLRMLLQARFADEPAWFARHYEAAVARIEDHTNDEENPYYHSPAEEADAYYGPVVLNEFGGEESPEEARERAFELLVLADLAPLTPAPKAA